ncbi:cytochrome P450 [Lentinula lateritia]|uniref:Cytochrome P450 n=1 Tax=Lentinula aff. lateritia TaxID=2804960 RepID=A0ACC1TLJ2_9AGAR|nr:cytochrome P450 [Lentinula aff. lateritia]KAJ3850090.1 cytochrome P450 [Lentinula lateritia]
MSFNTPALDPLATKNFYTMDIGKSSAMKFMFIGTLILLVVRLVLGFKNRGRLPPGPRGLPILGNALQLASVSQIWLMFDKWKSQYGPITYLNLAGQHIVVLNTKAAALELLERRSAIYSDRPKSIVGEYVGTALTMPFVRYDKRWQRMRRAAHAVLNVRASAQYQPVQIEEAVIFAHKLLYDTSSPLLTKIARSASTMISVIYGKQLLESSEKSIQPDALPEKHSSETFGPPSDPLHALLDTVHTFTNALAPGSHLVEFLPILDYLPTALARWKQNAKRDFQQTASVYESYYNLTVNSDNQQPNICVSLAENEVAGELTAVEKIWVTGAISAASLDTTTVTLSYFLYAMSLYPEVQERAQLLLDEVVGRSRMPNFDDMKQLPYIRAIVKEVLRWQPVTPLAIPHAAMEDDWYEGYLIPKGTIIFPNVWSMNHDQETYGPDADQFSPERFIQKSETGNGFVLRPEFENNDGHFSYGFGRRICVGRHVAENSLFITACTILWALHIEPKAVTTPMSKHGEAQDILNSTPDFDCHFSPRFPGVEGILQDTLAGSNVAVS